MPADNHFDPSIKPHSYRLLVGGLVTVVAFVLFGLFFLCMGFELLMVLFLASVGALIVGVLASRARAQVEGMEQLERDHAIEIQQFDRRLDALYLDSVVCLVSFDISSLSIDRASQGFFDLLGLSKNRSLKGVGIDEILSVEPSRLKAVVSGVKVGIVDIRETLICKQVDGSSIPLVISGCYRAEDGQVEMAFVYKPRKANELNDFERACGDISRFQQGVVRRENRILELKGEVNQLLRRCGAAARYQVDADSDDSRYGRQMTHAKRDEVDR